MHPPTHTRSHTSKSLPKLLSKSSASSTSSALSTILRKHTHTHARIHTRTHARTLTHLEVLSFIYFVSFVYYRQLCLLLSVDTHTHTDAYARTHTSHMHMHIFFTCVMSGLLPPLDKSQSFRPFGCCVILHPALKDCLQIAICPFHRSLQLYVSWLPMHHVALWPNGQDCLLGHCLTEESVVPPRHRRY